MDILTSFGENLSDIMFDRNLTAELLAAAVNIDRSVIYKYLRKECLPSLENIIVLADYFECSVDYLLGLTTVNGFVSKKVAQPFSERFKELLNSRGLTRYKFLKQIHFAKQSVDDWYNGKRVPTVENVIKLAEFFDCRVDYILGRES